MELEIDVIVDNQVCDTIKFPDIEDFTSANGVVLIPQHCLLEEMINHTARSVAENYNVIYNDIVLHIIADKEYNINISDFEFDKMFCNK